MVFSRILLAGTALAILPAAPAAAWHHRVRRIAQSPPLARPSASRPGAYPAGGWQAEVIARDTARMQAAPGLTNELAPDAKETATGGPVGGVPGFSGD